MSVVIANHLLGREFRRCHLASDRVQRELDWSATPAAPTVASLPRQTRGTNGRIVRYRTPEQHSREVPIALMMATALRCRSNRNPARRQAAQRIV